MMMPQRSIRTDEDLHWTLKEVVRDFDEIPHLLLRLTLTGGYFPQRAQEPYVKVGEVASRLVLLSEDGLEARAYFDRPIPEGAEIIFGYGNQIVYVFPGRSSDSDILRLVRARLSARTKIPAGM